MNTTILFLPVSSPSGIGEYMRSTIIANALLKESPNIEIHFGLNKHVPYFNDCQFVTHPFPNTPTKCTKEVYALIDELKPSGVVFDASGRASHVKYARKMGCAVFFYQST